MHSALPYYAVGDQQPDSEESYTLTEAPSRTIAGTTTVWAIAVNDNYYTVYSEAAAIAIAKRDITLTIGSDSTTFTGSEITRALPVTAAIGTANTGLLPGNTFTPLTASVGRTDVGTVNSDLTAGAIKIFAGNDDVTSNYNIVSIEQGALTITPVVIDNGNDGEVIDNGDGGDAADDGDTAVTTNGGREGNTPIRNTGRAGGAATGVQIPVAGDAEEAQPQPELQPTTQAQPPADNTDIGDPKVPTTLPDLPAQDTWALFNLLLTILTGILMLMLLITYFTRGKQEENESGVDIKSHGLYRLLSIVATALAIVIFVLTENVTLKMALIDSYTLYHAAILAVQAVLSVLARKKYESAKSE